MHALMVVLIEAAAMARKLDIAMPTLIEVLSRADGVMRPLEHRVAERMVTGDYAGGMSVHNARKDSMLALATAQDLGVPLFAILAAHTPYEIAEQMGMGEQDYASLARLWEQWCQVRFDAPAGGESC
jgi:3-hydroxyisobutyrate dehydrogenase-like beta-hydroxyacid dehydrogenase